MQKGTRVKIIGGKEGVGISGEVFWWGDSKYGDGMRAGVKGDDEATYWVDEADLETTDGEAPEKTDAPSEPKAPPVEQNAFARGDRVKVIAGKEKGVSGEIFWWGESKYGNGMRAGVETDAGDKVWTAGNELEKDGDAPTGSSASKPKASSASPAEHPESFAPSSEQPDYSEMPLPDEPPPEMDYISHEEIDPDY